MHLEICFWNISDAWKMQIQFPGHRSYFKREFQLFLAVNIDHVILYEPRHEKTNVMHMRKQRRRSAPLFSLHRYNDPSTTYIRKFKPLAIFCSCTAWFVSDLVGNPEDRFSQNEAHMLSTSCTGSHIARTKHRTIKLNIGNQYLHTLYPLIKIYLSG